VTRAPETGRAAARAAAAAFGCEPETIYKHADADEGHHVDILSCKDRPSPGLVSYSTLGVHLVPNLLHDEDFRVELAGIAEDSVGKFSNLLATAAFYVIKDRWHVSEGVVFEELVATYKLSKTLQHLMWVEPHEWEELAGVDVGGLIINWMLAVPISESERLYLLDNGYNRLQELFIDREVEYWDLKRRPVV